MRPSACRRRPQLLHHSSRVRDLERDGVAFHENCNTEDPKHLQRPSHAFSRAQDKTVAKIRGRDCVTCREKYKTRTNLTGRRVVRIERGNGRSSGRSRLRRMFSLLPIESLEKGRKKVAGPTGLGRTPSTHLASRNSSQHCACGGLRPAMELMFHCFGMPSNVRVA